MTRRRSFLLGLGTALAAPAVVRAESLMRIAVLRESVGKPFTLANLEAALADLRLRVSEHEWRQMFGVRTFTRETLQ